MSTNELKKPQEFIVRSKFYQIVRDKSEKSGDKITQLQIAEETGVSRNTVSVWMSTQEFDRIDLTAYKAFMRWAGLDPVGDFGEMFEFVEK